VASSLSPARPAKKSAIGLPVYFGAAVAVLAGGAYFYVDSLGNRTAADVPLSPEGRAYVRNLRLSDVTMKATDSYVMQRIVEVQGKVANAGDRGLAIVDINCVFYDGYGQLVLRKRVPIVSERLGGLKPGETKSFRLPFDQIPESWNQAMPQLVIAGVKFF
jgi:hypothetical protein